MFGYYISVPASATKGGKAVALPEEYVKRQSLKAEERCDLTQTIMAAAWQCCVAMGGGGGPGGWGRA